MAAPHIAGLAALIIQAMESEYDYFLKKANQVKNYLCGTATEVMVGERANGISNSPSIDRGEKDSVEGYGKAHADAAIEAALTEYSWNNCNR